MLAVRSNQKRIVGFHGCDVMLHFLLQLFFLFDLDRRVLFVDFKNLRNLGVSFRSIDQIHQVIFSYISPGKGLEAHNF